MDHHSKKILDMSEGVYDCENALCRMDLNEVNSVKKN